MSLNKVHMKLGKKMPNSLSLGCADADVHQLRSAFLSPAPKISDSTCAALIASRKTGH